MNLDNVSELTGVYLWKDSNNNVIYVGKAKCLKKRMSQYFLGTINSFKTSKMVEKIVGYETIICHNEKEALILERNLIQKYKPFYNVCLLDDRKYPYINLTINKEKLHISLKYVVKKESKYNVFYGPYLNNGSSRIILNFLRRECFYQNGLPIQKQTIAFWENKFNLAKNILAKNNENFILELKSKMFEASDKNQFEIANDLKNVILFLSKQKEVQIVELKNNENLDVVVGIPYQDFIFFCIQFYRNGSLINSNNFISEINISVDDTTRQFINQFYKDKQLPKKIITNLEIEQEDIFFETKLEIPKQGKYFSILNLCLKNIEQNKDLKIYEYRRKNDLISEGLSFLSQLIKTENLNHIIMIDNSNNKNSNCVSVVISLRNGTFQKNEYRKFNITVNSRKSDVEYIKQGLEKYFNKKNDIPNLLIVDGGIQQINEAKTFLKKINLKIPIIGLVKNQNHKTDFILLENNEKISLTNNNIFLFFSKMQEEVDQFAKSFHRNKKSKSSLEGKLMGISGIGPKTEQKILNHFKTYNNIYNASLAELEKIVSKNIAKNIVKNFKT